MGYNAYITRADNFWETLDFPILEREWLAVAEADPELSLSSDGYTQYLNREGDVERVYAWVYITHPDKPPLWFINGAIETKNPDKRLVAKMVALAEKLQAKVIGEEGEVYNVSDADSRRKPWWRRLLGE